MDREGGDYFILKKSYKRYKKDGTVTKFQKMREYYKREGEPIDVYAYRYEKCRRNCERASSRVV